jgi:hypothetical protein
MLLLASGEARVWFSHEASQAKEACLHAERWLTQSHDTKLDLPAPSATQVVLPWFLWPRRAWDDTLQKSTAGMRATVKMLLAKYGAEILDPSTLVKHEAWDAARALAAKFLTSDYGKVEADIPGVNFAGYLRGANSSYNKRFCGSRGQLPANYIVDGKGLHDDPEVVAGILRIGLYLNSQWQDG